MHALNDIHTESQVLPPVAIFPSPPQSSGHVFFSARHHADFWEVGTSVAGTLQHGMTLVEFWADAKPERAATATKTVAYNIVN
jgi:hypothetical protein